jgi:hypothetical protein
LEFKNNIKNDIEKNQYNIKNVSAGETNFSAEGATALGNSQAKGPQKYLTLERKSSDFTHGVSI